MSEKKPVMMMTDDHNEKGAKPMGKQQTHAARLAAAKQAGYLRVGRAARDDAARDAWFEECEKENRPYILVIDAQRYADVQIDTIATRPAGLPVAMYRACHAAILPYVAGWGRARVEEMSTMACPSERVVLVYTGRWGAKIPRDAVPTVMSAFLRDAGLSVATKQGVAA